MIDTGGPAFPVAIRKEDEYDNVFMEVIEGATLLDLAAIFGPEPTEEDMRVMARIEWARTKEDAGYQERDSFALRAEWKYRQAQALIAEKRRLEEDKP